VADLDRGTEAKGLDPEDINREKNAWECAYFQVAPNHKQSRFSIPPIVIAEKKKMFRKK
jgi:hypothetical protein